MKDKSQKEIIKNICVEFNCTQKELADELGVSASAINQWSSSKRKIPNWFFKFTKLLKEVKTKKQVIDLL